MVASITYDSKSIYSDTPIRDFYLDIWVEKNILPSPEDRIWIIENKYHIRPDLAAYDFYGSEKYWYVFALRNKDILIDPIRDFTAGTLIIVPSKKSVSAL